jgi:hypothetical protein
MLNHIFEKFIDRRREAAFEEGFWGETFARFKRIGPDTVRHLYESNKLSEIDHNGAEIWLARHDRRETVRMALLGYLAPTISGLSLIATIIAIWLRVK